MRIPLHPKSWMQTKVVASMCQEFNKTEDQGKTRSEKSEIKHKEF